MEETDTKVKLKKELGLFEGVSVILGIIIGSGIFITPKGVLQATGSIGASLIVWIACGLLALIGALCYTELGTTIPKSGGDYAYIYEAFGPAMAFLYLWVAAVVFVPTTNAILGLTFANYVIQPFFELNQLPESATRLLAAVVICGLTFINCYNVRITSKLADFFMITKVGVLIMIIIAGLTHLFLGNTMNFHDMFQGTNTSPSHLAVSFYSGIFSYAGWNYLNFMTEELKNPYVNLPRAIYISLPLVTVVYVLANVGYFAVLTSQQILASNAIAVTFADKLLGSLNWVMPLLVALSALGGLSVHIMTCSRLMFVAARQGLFPDIFALIDIRHLTPSPSLIFMGILSLLMLVTTNVFVLIEYSSFVEALFILTSILGMLFLRWKQPLRPRPIKIHILFPIIFLFICGFLVFLPLYVRPVEVGVGLLITVSGIPVYLIGVRYKRKPKFLKNTLITITTFLQKLLLTSQEETQ